MDAHTHRGLVRQLAADLGWLEGHCRKQPDLAAHAGQLRLAAALARNVAGPAAEGVAAPPLHLAVVGGAGAGKSTVVNFLVGSVVAAANPQAGYTRHPTAFAPAGINQPVPSTLGFLGPLRRLTEEVPADRDEDVYQVRRVSTPGAGPGLAAEFVVWDCPDMTTWASANYVGRLMEVVGLADVVVYVASDERYNDEVPTQFLHHVVRAGKAVVVCLTKMRPADAPALVSHFRKEILARLPANPAGDVPVVTLPHLAADVRDDPGGAGAKHRVALLNEILALCPDPAAARARTVQNAVAYLDTAAGGLLDVARQDLAAFDAWRGLVSAGRGEFEARYRREFLAGEAFRRFDRTREQVLEMLELPGPGRVVSATLGVLRLPYRYLRDFLARLASRPDAPSQPEQTVCSVALAAWLDALQADALRRADTHPVWRQVTRGFDAGLKSEAFDRFLQVFRQFEMLETDELDRAASAIPAALSKSPGLLAVLRVGAVTLDVALIALVVVLTWVPSLLQLLLIPLAVSLGRQAVELAVRAAVEAGRARVRNHRETLVRQHLSGPLAAWLADWPASGSSDLGALQQVLRRVPETIRELAALLRPAPTAPTPGGPPA